MEIIVVNDGSADATLDIARKFASNTVRVLTQENEGAPSARNKALSLSWRNSSMLDDLLVEAEVPEP